MIETTHGPMDEAQMERSEGVIDDETRFCSWTELRVPGTTEVYRREGGFPKVNAFESMSVLVDGQVPIDEQDGKGIVLCSPLKLERKLGVVDEENNFISWVEYRRIGSDKIVHRSVDVKVKKAPAGAPAASAGAGNVNGSAQPSVPFEKIVADSIALAEKHTERVRTEIARTYRELCRDTVDAFNLAGHANINITVDWDGAANSFKVSIRK